MGRPRDPRFRHVKVYYRDRERVMRVIPGITLFIDGGVLVKVYTLQDNKGIKIDTSSDA